MKKLTIKSLNAIAADRRANARRNVSRARLMAGLTMLELIRVDRIGMLSACGFRARGRVTRALLAMKLKLATTNYSGHTISKTKDRM